jgi:CHAT domain-containing protein
MVRLQYLWNPAQGQGLGVARTLVEAQASVRAKERWKHPYYWAA